MTDFPKPVNWGADGPYLAAVIQSLNAIGALLLVYAFRYGRPSSSLAHRRGAVDDRADRIARHAGCRDH
jgi:hypothetical protein